ncbi:hypothetical protein PPROV_000083000 [Pycnococcus provasolii]|uniref:EF-hand domain-containing protein n=1 Tax=Pycnococcus provasolii TaxID=41880 RepID=A0A830H4V8_9CHLO|nr:hypothetical protein PPROV_000083000 [Pycnococcus provasolii]
MSFVLHGHMPGLVGTCRGILATTCLTRVTTLFVLLCSGKEHIEKLRKVFEKRAAEEKSATTMNLREFQEAMGDVGIDLTSDLGKLLAGPLFSAFDTDGESEVSFKEFVKGIAALTTGSLEERMRLAFDILDANHDHVLSREELVGGIGSIARALAAGNSKAAPAGAAAELGLPFETPEEADVAAFVDELLKSHGSDGQLTLAQFLEASEVHPLLTQVQKSFVGK